MRTIASERPATFPFFVANQGSESFISCCLLASPWDSTRLGGGKPLVERREVSANLRLAAFAKYPFTKYLAVAEIRDTVVLRRGSHPLAVKLEAPATPLREYRLLETLRSTFVSDAVTGLALSMDMFRLGKHWMGGKSGPTKGSKPETLNQY